jgi:hypothetical protein
MVSLGPVDCPLCHSTPKWAYALPSWLLSFYPLEWSSSRMICVSLHSLTPHGLPRKQLLQVRISSSLSFLILYCDPSPKKFPPTSGCGWRPGRRTKTGWWFQIFFIFHNIWDVILPIDELIFFRGIEATNQKIWEIVMVINGHKLSWMVI